jgi:FlaA1/EpsC-like NDP-sugar epimerase
MISCSWEALVVRLHTLGPKIARGKITVSTTTFLTDLKTTEAKALAGNRMLRFRLPLILTFQAVVACLSYLGAFLIRFDFNIPPDQLALFYVALPLALCSRMAGYLYFRTYANSWGFAGMRELTDDIKATLLGSISFILIMVFTLGSQGFPRSVLVLEPVLSLMLLGAGKFIFRYRFYSPNSLDSRKVKHTLIVGAGRAGVSILNEIQNNTRLASRVIGFVDDNPYKKGTTIQGVAVLGSTEEIPELAGHYDLDEIIIAIPSAGYKEIVRIRSLCDKTDAKTMVLPTLSELMRDQQFTSQLREVSYDDLLGRKAIRFCRETDRKLLEGEIRNKTVLVTGAGGSIGSELCRQIVQHSPRLLILLERHENSLYDLELDLRKEFPEQAFLPVVGDILDVDKIDRLFGASSVNLVYHAAAYKHVPMMEREPIEAIRNNVFGTLNLARLARTHRVEKFILISSDKAVRPTNIMGTTKRVAELIIKGMLGEGTKFVAVRFGNVLGSNGSVIPVFRKQIANGGPVTVTHSETTRYFMSISEAVQLVMVAGTLGDGGEIFLLDMGEPVKIVDLARRLISLSGFQADKDVEIVFTGLRPGEKLHEELYWRGEGIVPTENKKITMWKPDGLDTATLFSRLSDLEKSIEANDIRAVITTLADIVPEAKICSPVVSAMPRKGQPSLTSIERNGSKSSSETEPIHHEAYPRAKAASLPV